MKKPDYLGHRLKIRVASKEDAWKEVYKIFPDGVTLNEEESKIQGAPIYYTAFEGDLTYVKENNDEYIYSLVIMFYGDDATYNTTIWDNGETNRFNNYGRLDIIVARTAEDRAELLSEKVINLEHENAELKARIAELEIQISERGME